MGTFGRCNGSGPGEKRECGGCAYFLVGPTASGKSAVAQWIAEHHDYDILSADSMLIYRGMDIGTAKPSKDMRSRVRYFGVDLTTPDKLFSVWDYSKYGLRVISANSAEGRKTIVVGGTGLYIKALIEGIEPLPGSVPAARRHWEGILKKDGVEELQRALRERSPSLYDELKDKANTRRLIRALELSEQGVKELPRSWANTRRKEAPPGDETGKAAMAGISVPPDELNKRMETRIAEMHNSGIVEEVEELLRNYSILSDTAKQAIGYAEVMELIAGRCSKDEAIARTLTRTRQYAKRQRTWFRHQAVVNWIEVRDKMDVEEISRLVLECWNEHGPTRIAG